MQSFCRERSFCRVCGVSVVSGASAVCQVLQVAGSSGEQCGAMEGEDWELR